MSRYGAALVAVVGLSLMACGKKDQNADTAAVGSGATASAAPAPTAGSSASATASLSDPNIVYLLDQASAADSARGRLAMTKGTSTVVKDFGRLMVGEHHALRLEGQQLAKKLNVTPQAPPNDQNEAQAKTEMDSLNAMAKGKAWDKAYIDYEVPFHEALMQTATKALDAAQNPELKDLIKKAAPVVQKHIDHAKAAQQKLGS